MENKNIIEEASVEADKLFGKITLGSAEQDNAFEEIVSKFDDELVLTKKCI